MLLYPTLRRAIIGFQAHAPNIMVMRMASPRLLAGRMSQPGAMYVVTAITLSRIPLFLDPVHARAIIDEINHCEEEGRLQSLAWVVMPDHVHWMLKLCDTSLSSCMQAFKSRSGRAVNKLRGHCGPVWQAGFHDHRLRDPTDFRAHARYIVANPLRKGLVERIEDYAHWHCAWIKCSADL